MRWTTWLLRQRSRRLSLLRFDVSPEACSLVALTVSASQPDSDCCAKRLHLPEGLVAQGEVLRTEALGVWLCSYLAAGDFQPKGTELPYQVAAA